MVRVAPIKKYCKRYSDIVPIEHTFKEHRLMVCPYADYDHKINPIGYKFPESGLKNISYYRDCTDVDHYDPLFGDIDFMDEVLCLDYKLIDKAIDNPNTMIRQWGTGPNNKKGGKIKTYKKGGKAK